MSFCSVTADGLRLRLKIKPQSRGDSVDGPVPDVDGEALAVSVSAPPVDGKANTAVIALLARTWRLPASSFAVVRGATARRKLLSVAGDPATLSAVIEAWRSSRA